MTHRSILNKRVLLTGASSGIGNQLARKLFALGARLIVTARRAERLESLVHDLKKQRSNSGGEIEFLTGDICSSTHREQLINQCSDRWGGLDVLINNAGAGAIGPFSDSEPERLRKVMEVDFFSAVELSRMSLPLLRMGDDPAILNIGSVLGIRAVPDKSEYCAAKFAIRGWSESVRCELKSAGIEVMLVNPSTTRSEFFDSLIDTPSGAESRSVGSMSDSAVAAQIIRALERRKREVVLSLGGRALVWVGRWFPKLTDKLVTKKKASD